VIPVTASTGAGPNPAARSSRPGSGPACGPDEVLIGFVGIEEAARLVGVSPSAIRLWERQGLVRPIRTGGGARRFGPDDVARLHAIRRWRRVEGLNAAAIRRLVDVPQAVGPGRAGHADPDRRPGRAPVPAPALERAGRPPGEPPGGAPAQLAHRLRELRLSRRLTLRQVAGQSGLSVSFVSSLERSLTGVSLATLRRLTAAYGTTVAELVRDPGLAAGRLVRSSARRSTEAGAGIRIEELADAPSQLESQLFVLQPGASSEGYYAHPGEEFMYLLGGALGVWLGEDEYYELGPGDALTFPSTLAHRVQALGPGETRLIWINTPPTF